MRHRASAAFWKHYDALPQAVREQADWAFRTLKADPKHPSLHFKKAGKYWSARVNVHYRVLAVEKPDGFVWVWIGAHDRYERLL